MLLPNKKTFLTFCILLDTAIALGSQQELFVQQNTIKTPDKFIRNNLRKYENLIDATGKKTIASQRENWFQHSDYIAETWCTASNIGFLIVANTFKKETPIASGALLLAGVCSALSHAIPYQPLNMLDQIAAVGSIAGIAYNCHLFKMSTLVRISKNIPIGTLGITTLAIHGTDLGLSYNQKLKGYRVQWQTITHVLWHLSATFLAYLFLLDATRNNSLL